MYQLNEEHYKTISIILAELDIDFFVFGSRTKGSAKKLSDLDLLIKQDFLQKDLSILIERFENSSLPFKVDIVLWSQISSSFKEQIKDDLILWKGYEAVKNN